MSHINPEWADLGFPACPIPPPENPYDEDGYCEFCGNGEWKYHAPWCAWADVTQGVTFGPGEGGMGSSPTFGGQLQQGGADR